MIKRICCAALALLTLSACTSLPPLDFTVADIAPVAQPVDGKLAAVSVDRAPGADKKAVQADDLMFPLWKEALSSAVAKAKLFNDTSARSVKIVVQVTRINPPSFGIDMVTTSTAKYEVTDATTGAVLFSKVIEARGVTPGDYAFVGAVRAHELMNRTVRVSISEFIEALKASGLSPAH